MSNRSNTEKPEKRKRLGSKEEDCNMTPLIEVQTQTLDKMSEMVDAINKLKEQVKIMNQNGQMNTKKIEKAITKSSSDVVKELGKIATIQTNTMSGLQNAAMGDLVRKEIPNWQNLLNERKLDYWEFLRNQRIAATYSRWRENAPPIIPKTYQPRLIVGESEEYRQLRIKMATDQMKNDDKQILRTITEIFRDNADLQESTKRQWLHECQKEEKYLKNVGQKKKNGIKNKNIIVSTT